MTIYVLILALMFEGEIHFAAFNGNIPGKVHEFKSRAACEKERAAQLAQMDRILAPGATLVDLTCVALVAQGGA